VTPRLHTKPLLVRFRTRCGSGEEIAEHLLLFCPKWAVERQQYFGDSVNILDVFQDSDNLVEFLISLEHVPLI